LKTKDIITPEVKERIELAIAESELGTSGEIRVHVEDECKEEVLDRAAYIFSELGMQKTELRNGIMLYVAISDKKAAIIGDVGINQFFRTEEWDEIRNRMIGFFKNNDFENGIIRGIKDAGEKIKAHYPISSDDINELPNTISIGNKKEKHD
jgi:uncharacterized membrane protein